MNVFNIRAGIVAIALGASLASHAAVVVDFQPNQVSGDNMSYALVADNFSLGVAYNLTSIKFWSVQSLAADYSGNVYWAIRNDAAGTPGATLFSNTAAVAAAPTGNSTGFGYGEYEISIPVAFQLAAGNYWLALQNAALGSTNLDEMLWETSSTGIAPTGQFTDFTNNRGFIDSGNEHAFQIIGDVVIVDEPPTVPEPTTLALLLVGLVAAGTVRRRARIA